MAEKEYIERELAEKTIDRFEGYLDDDMIFRIKYALRKHIPAADVAPAKHGHWVSEYDCGYITPHCSECGETALTKEETSYDYVYSSYCPRCGAKMGGGDGE